MTLPASATGHAFALAAAAIWAVSPMMMASAGRKIGSFPVLLLRSLLATILFVALIGGRAAAVGHFPVLPNTEQAVWLAVSGIIGMGVGDILIYEAFVTLGARRTSQILVLAPAVAVVVAWMLLGERLSAQSLIGVVVTLGGTFYAVLAGQPKPAVAGGEASDVPAATTPHPPRPLGAASSRGEPGHVTGKGVLYSIGGAVCMAIGAVFVRRAFRDNPSIDSMVATFLRITAAGVLLWVVPVVRNQVPRTLALLRNGHVMSRVGVGTLLGPGLGMFCYVAALRAIPAGLVSTLVATTPLFAIPVTILRYRVHIRWDVWLAAATAVAGVAVMVW